MKGNIMKLRMALLSSLFLLSPAVTAATDNENLNVKIYIENGEAKVVINSEINGESQTIEQTFAVDSETDVDAMVDNILTENGIEHSTKEQQKEVIKLVKQGENDHVWTSKIENVNVDLLDGKAKVIIKKDDNGEVEVIEQWLDVNNKSDINAIMNELMSENDLPIDDDTLHKKIIKLDKNTFHFDNNKPRMGFMANVKDNGWEVLSVVPGSGAEKAGLKKGDVVLSIDDQSTERNGLGLTEFIAMDHQAGDVSKVVVLRDKKHLTLDVTAQVIDSPDIIMELDADKTWFSSSDKDFKFKTGDLDGMFKGLHVDVEYLEKMLKGMDNPNIHVVTTGDADAYFFAGSKMNRWLGNNHHFSTITETLGSYFGTSEGVLVLEVDNNNRLGLQDGDVIIAINGTAVKSPKEVIKLMTSFKSDEAFEIEIIRQKETLYLES